MTDIVPSVASKVAEYLVAPVGRHCGYVICSDRYVRQLNDEVKKLDHARQRVQHSIDDARNKLKPIEADVQDWVDKEKTIATKASDVLKNDRNAKKTCFYGWLPNPKARYRLGKEASRTVKAIQALILQGKFERVYYESAPPGLVGGAPDVNSSAGDGADTITDSRASIFQGIMKALDDEKHKVIGVYGPGGVGKTTLLEEVEKKLRKEERPSQMIVKSKVSENPDLKKIQDDIAYALGLNLKDEPSEEGRRDLLFKRLKKDPEEKKDPKEKKDPEDKKDPKEKKDPTEHVLIILDDLWGALDLKAVGIPSGDESVKCKLLLTSRDKSVLEQKMGADRTFHLKGLSDKEAFSLFERTVGDKLKDDEELKAKAAQVVRKLAGLPLLITSVARTLKYSNVYSWENMIKIDGPEIERIVKCSYDHLESEDAKCLFLLCGLIGGTIEVELLLGLGMGLGLFDRSNNSVQESRNRLNVMLESLHSFCLLQDGGDGKENVTIHDLYSEVVRSDAFSGQISLMIKNNYGLWPKEKFEKCWACLVNVGNDRLAELMLRRFPDVKILMLSEQYDRGDCSRMDFTHMEELRALYLCYMRITSLPSSMEILGNLRSLSINCYVEDVANLGKLKALQILSFAGSTIYRLPKEIGELTNLRSLNLSRCYSLRIIEPGALKGLINLEELHMKGSFYQWMGKDEIPSESCNASLAELKSLKKLTVLEISIPDPAVLFKDGDLPFENLIKFWINIGHVDGREFQGLRTMGLKLEDSDSILSKEWVQKTLQKTQYLHLDGLRQFKKNAHELCIRGFTQLKHLDIQNSPSIKYIANSSSDLCTAFAILESLFLENLINLVKICNGPVAPDCFSKLKTVRIEKCHQLKNMWSSSGMQRLTYLEEIELCECDSLQAIITDDVGKVEVDGHDMVELPNVRRLALRKLPNMTSFCTRTESAPIQVSFRNLNELSINNTGLSFLFSVSVAKCLREIRDITVEDCPNMKAVIVDEEGRDEGTYDIIEFPLLEQLSIRCCPTEKFFSYRHGKKESITTSSDSQDTYSNSFFDQKISLPSLENLTLDSVGFFKSIWHSELPKSSFDKLANLTPKQDVQLQGISILPNLQELYVCNTGLSFLFPVSVAKCLREIRDITVEDCPNMKAVIVDEEGRDEGTYDIIEFPLLEQLSIERCPMEKFFSYPHGKKESITISSDSQDTYSDSFFDQKVTFPNIETLELEGLRCKELWNSQIPTDSFRKLESLELKDCGNLQRIASSHMWKRLQSCLEILEVISCCLIEIIYEGDGMDSEGGKLRQLVLCDLENLRHIWQSNGVPNVPFPNLKYVEVEGCSRLKMLFPTFTAEFLGQIKELLVKSCEDMELIAGHEKREEGTGTKITFSELNILTLFELPKFKSFLPEKFSLKFPHSEDFGILTYGAERNPDFPSLLGVGIVSCGAEPNWQCLRNS